MSSQVNGTYAKDIAFHFFSAFTDGKYTKTEISRTILLAKQLLAQNYTKEQIILVIDFLERKGQHIYSFGFVNKVMEDTLRQIEALQLQEKGAQLRKEQELRASELQKEVMDDGSTERNQRKADRISVQSRKRTQHYFDMFEGK